MLNGLIMVKMTKTSAVAFAKARKIFGHLMKREKVYLNKRENGEKMYFLKLQYRLT